MYDFEPRYVQPDDESPDFEETRSVKEVAGLLRVHWQTVLTWIKNEELKALKIGHNYRITASAYREFMSTKRFKDYVPEIKVDPEYRIEEEL